MDAKQINQTFDLLGYVGSRTALRKSGAYFTGPCPMCGGRDRFQIKQTPDGDLWICRKCAPEKYHSAVDFFMFFHQLDFKQALERMGGDPQQQPRQESARGKPVRSPASVQVVPDQAWQVQAWQQIDEASDRLLYEPEGEPGRRYLIHRGLSQGSMYMNLLGYAIAYNRPAIVIPWMDVGNVVTAVKYRFIDDLARNDKSRRFAMLSGSRPYLFGLQHVLPSDDTLLFVEGEINAISILQTLPRGVSVVSAGGDTNGNAALLRTLASPSHYSRVFIWTDAVEKARDIREKMQRHDAHLLKSPLLDGTKWDANQILQAGLLMDFLKAKLSTDCLGVPGVIDALRVTAPMPG